MTDVQQTLQLGELHHLGIAVRNMEEGIARLAAFGLTVGPVWDFSIPSRYRGLETRAGVKAAFASAGPIMLELVEPTAGDSSISQKIRYLWRFSELLLWPVGTCIPRGVRKYRSIEEANADRDRWEKERVDRIRVERKRYN